MLEKISRGKDLHFYIKTYLKKGLLRMPPQMDLGRIKSWHKRDRNNNPPSPTQVHYILSLHPKGPLLSLPRNLFLGFALGGV